jgi:hypothetical protein
MSMPEPRHRPRALDTPPKHDGAHRSGSFLPSRQNRRLLPPDPTGWERYEAQETSSGQAEFLAASRNSSAHTSRDGGVGNAAVVLMNRAAGTEAAPRRGR